MVYTPPESVTGAEWISEQANPVTNSPNDWNVGISISYPNYAALDQLAAKGATIVNKHFGSRDAALASAKKQDDIREVITSHLAREVMSK